MSLLSALHLLLCITDLFCGVMSSRTDQALGSLCSPNEAFYSIKDIFSHGT